MALSYKLTNKEVEKLKTLSLESENAYSQLLKFPEEKREFIKKQSLVSNIGASTRIENAILTNAEVEWIDTKITENQKNEYKFSEEKIKNKLTKDKERSIEEVAGVRDTLKIVLESPGQFFPLKESDIKGLHRELLKYYPKAGHYLGNYKKQSNNVIKTDHLTGKTTPIFTPADPGIVTETAMGDLIKWVNIAIQEETWSLAVATEFTFRFLAIHPFQDGNGRLSRILFELILMVFERDNLGKLVPYNAIDRNIEKRKAEYYSVLHHASKGSFKANPKKYGYDALLEYFINCTKDGFKNITHYSEKYEKLMSFSETATAILSLFKESPEALFQTNDIVEKMNFPRRTAIYAINQLLEAMFIQKKGSGPQTKYQLIF